jgi:hypothetical protein
MSEYLSLKETADLLRISPATVETRIKRGIFVRGVHFFTRKGMRPLFKRSAIIAWVEGQDAKPAPKQEASIPMRRGYNL